MQGYSYTLTGKLAEVTKRSLGKVVLQKKTANGYEKHTYRGIESKSQKIAAALAEMGIKKGDRVVIVLENCPEWIFIYFGILLIGAIAVPVYPQSTVEEVKYFLDNSEGKVVFTSQNSRTIVCEAAEQATISPQVVLLDSDKICYDSVQSLSFDDFLNLGKGAPPKIDASPDDVVSIIYTSGTTDEPKGVMLTHRNFYASAHGISQMKDLNFQPRVLSILPFNHLFPFVANLLVPLFNQGQIVFVSEIKLAHMLQCMRETKVNIFVGVPQFFYFFHQTILDKIENLPFYIRFLLLGVAEVLYVFRRLTGINLSRLFFSKIHSGFGKSLKYFVSGGARIDEDTEIFLQKMGFLMLQGYGLTETGVISVSPLKRPKIGSVGLVISDVKIKIIDQDNKGIGEVVVCGSGVMKGYYRREEDTQKLLKDGWFYTGDLGYIDSGDYLFLTGRKKDLIIMGSGKNISPEEVEEHYRRGAYIKELCVLAVGGDKDERLVAVVVPDFDRFKETGEIDIYNTIKLELEIFSQGYPVYKCIMGFVITKEDLPRTRLGKLKRYEVRNKYLGALLGVQSEELRDEELSDDELQIISSEIYQAISSTIENKSQFKKSVHLHDHIGIDLGFDSLGRIELIAALEEQFNIDISEMLVARIATVKELVGVVERVISEQKSSGVGRIFQPRNLWRDILTADPEKTVLDRIDINPGRFARIFYRAACGGLSVISKMMWRIKVSGIENLPKNGPIVLCPNHPSMLDAFLTLSVMPNWLRKKIFFLGYHTYFEVPIIRNLVKTVRVIPIDPGTHLVDAMRASGYALRNDRAICIFPEGERSVDGSIHNFKKGVGILAKELNVRLVPVYIEGAFDALPRGKILPKMNHIKIVFGKPYFPSELKALGSSLGGDGDYGAIARGIEEKVRELGAKLS